MSPARNKRIMGAEFLNRSCAFDARLESMLLGAPLKSLFQQHRSNPVLRVFPLHVRLGAASGIQSGAVQCRTRARNGLMRRSKQQLYSITSSAMESTAGGTSIAER